jgi:hypothetical protein
MKDPFFFYAVDMADRTANRHPGGDPCQAMDKCVRSSHFALRRCALAANKTREAAILFPTGPFFFRRSLK